MNFFSRLGRGIVIMMPTGVVAFVLMYGAWTWTCDTQQCRGINMMVMLTGLVLAIWSLIILFASLVANKPEEGLTIGKSLRVNLTEILPSILGYAAFTGFMAYFSFALFKEHLAGTDMGENKTLFFCSLFIPVYELTRVFERKKSITIYSQAVSAEYTEAAETPGFGTQVLLHAQSYLTFAGWQYLMLFILKNKDVVPVFDKAGKTQFFYLLLVMAAASFLLYKAYSYIENFLRTQEVISWSSKYFGKS